LGFCELFVKQSDRALQNREDSIKQLREAFNKLPGVAPNIGGFITLFRVAVRNGLLLVDNYNNKFAQGMHLKDVIVKGSLERVNAILMTALTSALGILPLAISSSAGNEILQPLAIVVLSGLFTSTALTLLVIPAIYAKFGKWLIPNQKTVEEKETFALEPEPQVSVKS